MVDNFEVAALPTTSEEDRKRLLSFVVCGGGPTGVETAAEIYDLCQEDLMNYVGVFRALVLRPTDGTCSSRRSAGRRCPSMSSRVARIS